MTDLSGTSGPAAAGFATPAAAASALAVTVSCRPDATTLASIVRAATLAVCVAGLWANVPARAEERPRDPASELVPSDAGNGGAAADAGAADALARARLDAFTGEVDSFRAAFEQTLYDADSTPLQSSSGTVVLKRPGRFVWDYREGADGGGGGIGQTIVADGERIWLYDRELAQVTVNAIDERIAGTPFVLLMGSAPLDETYEVTALGASDGVEWLELVPKAAGGDFEALFVGLDDAGLAALELRDNFGQATQILFSDFEADIDVDDSVFEFEVPEGVDVIGLEEGG